MEEVKENMRPMFTKKELLINAISIVILSALMAIITYFIPQSNETITIGEITVIKSQIVPSVLLSAVSGIVLNLVYILPFSLKEKNKYLTKATNWVILTILYLLGIVAHLVLVIGCSLINLPFWASSLIAGLIELTYLYLMIKLYMFGYVEDKRLLFEIIRFALVGVIAALFDFCTCFIFEYYICASLEPVWSTIISVTCGFIIGVTVNYLCSVYMVFKATTEKDKSRTAFGRFLFVTLSAVGLFIGIGLQYLFYDFLKIGYVTVFVIRTLIVLVWNYLSRKYFIFR